MHLQGRELTYLLTFSGPRGKMWMENSMRQMHTLESSNFQSCIYDNIWVFNGSFWHIYRSEGYLEGGKEGGRETKLAKDTRTNGGQSSDCQLGNLRDRRWRRIVFCLVNPRPLRFLACNTSPSISSNRSPLLALHRSGLLCKPSGHLHRTFPGNWSSVIKNFQIIF